MKKYFFSAEHRLIELHFQCFKIVVYLYIAAANDMFYYAEIKKTVIKKQLPEYK